MAKKKSTFICIDALLHSMIVLTSFHVFAIFFNSKIMDCNFQIYFCVVRGKMLTHQKLNSTEFYKNLQKFTKTKANRISQNFTKIEKNQQE